MATTELTRDGSKKVKEACQEIMTREDEALAHRLQDEEFQSHYIRNRKERSTARIDVKTAKNAYLEEVKQAGLLRGTELQRLAEDDAWLATELQHRLNEEEDLETQQRVASEMQDEEYAQFLQEREKEKVKKERQRRLKKRLERERQELDKIEHDKNARVRSSDSTSRQQDCLHADTERKKSFGEDKATSNGLAVDVITTAEAGNEMRPSEPGPQATAREERSRHQELEDEEMARRLQQREDEKLRKLMEERDRMLALRMQKKETEDYRRERAERQSRKARTTHGNESQATEEQIRQSRNDSYRYEKESGKRCPDHKHCDPSLHYYEEPVLHKELSYKASVGNSDQFDKEENALFDTKASSVASRFKTDIAIYEDVHPPSAFRIGNAPDLVSNGKIEGNRLQTSSADTAHTTQRDDTSQKADRHNFTNVAASIDPTFKGEIEDTPPDEDRVWAIGDSGIKVSSASKPAPLIQNTKRKHSKNAKDKDKCKQQ